MEMAKRKPTRLKNYDYSTAGAYFVTVCTHDKRCIFWNNRRDNPCGCPTIGDIRYSEYGKIADMAIEIVAKRFNIIIDNYAVMPNHVHMIIVLEGDPSRTPARSVPTISGIVGAYKSIVSVECIKIFNNKNQAMGRLWQRSFHDHIIRCEQDY